MLIYKNYTIAFVHSAGNIQNRIQTNMIREVYILLQKKQYLFDKQKKYPHISE